MSKTKIAIALLVAVSTAAPAASPTSLYSSGQVRPGNGISCWEAIAFTGVGMPDVGPLNRGMHWGPCL